MLLTTQPIGCRFISWARDCGPYADVRQASADRPLSVRWSSTAEYQAHLGWQVEFMTCTAGDATHSEWYSYLAICMFRNEQR
jgi:hypothetical protein